MTEKVINMILSGKEAGLDTFDREFFEYLHYQSTGKFPDGGNLVDTNVNLHSFERDRIMFFGGMAALARMIDQDKVDPHTKAVLTALKGSFDTLQKRTEYLFGEMCNAVVNGETKQ